MVVYGMLRYFRHASALIVHATRDLHAPSGTKRSPHWPAVRKAYLADHPICAACGGFTALEVHHVVPFAKNPSKELDPLNLITLCMAIDRHCHLVLHGGSFRAYDTNVVHDATAVLRARRAHDTATLQKILDRVRAERVPL